MKKLFVLAGVALLPLSWAGAAQAADGAYNWSGFYLGANAGVGSFDTTIDDKDCNLSCSSQHLGKMGVLAGVTAGVNHQMGSAVIGLEGDWSWASAKKNRGDSWSHYRTKWNSLATLRARAGLALDRSLIYVTGGLALAKVKATGRTDGEDFGDDYSFRSKKTRTGLVVGAGFEQALGEHISMKGEYLHVAINSRDVHDLYSDTDYMRYGVKPSAELFRLGVNFKF